MKTGDAEYQRERRKRRIAAGLCVTCPRGIIILGASCEACKLKARVEREEAARARAR
jgi:hypothetical protein